jgi:hypothetical protein
MSLPVGDEPAGGSFRTIAQLAERVGHYCWVERRLFELTGQWASAGGGSAAVRVFFSELSPQHAAAAAQWSDRLPVRAGVDAALLVTPPPGPLNGALGALDAEPDPTRRLGGLTKVVLPRVLSAYEEHRADASPVSEAPILAVLDSACQRISREITRGTGLLQRGLPDPGQAEFCRDLERSFGGALSVSPGVRPS